MKSVSLLVILMCMFLPLMLPAQTENWIYRYSYGETNAVAFGDDGNIYAAGCIWDTTTFCDFAVISLTAAGDTNWVYRYSAVPYSDNCAYSLVYGDDGNIYAAGYTDFFNFAVISLTPAGNMNWVYECMNGGTANSIVYGADGNIYAAGGARQLGLDFTVISLTADGDTNWIRRLPYGEAYSITYGTDGNIYAAGENFCTNYYDFTIVSFTSTGDTNWVYRYGPGEAYSLIYGADGYIYAAGAGSDQSMNADFLVVSLTTTGDTNWTYGYNGAQNSSDKANSLVYGADGNIYAAGRCLETSPLFTFTIISLTTAGDTNWIYQYDNSYGEPLSIVFGSDNNIYASGYTYYQYNLMIVSLTTSGDTNWVYLYSGLADARSLDYGADGNIYAVGVIWGSGILRDFTVISLSPDLGIQEYLTTVKSDNINTTIFRGPLQLPEDKKCKVYDITGRLVEPNRIAPGIYFIEIDGVVTQKVVKVR